MNTPVKRCSNPECGKEFPATPEYFQPIKKRDGSPTLTGRCRECLTAYKSEYYRKNKERHNENTRQWQKDNPGRAKDIKKRYIENNPEARKQSVKKYRENNKEECAKRINLWKKKNWAKVLQQAKARYWKNPEKYRERGRRYSKSDKGIVYRKSAKNKVNIKIVTHRRLARKRLLPDTMTSVNWQHCLDYFNGCCAYCGRSAGLWHVIAMEHYIPLSDPDCPGTIPANILPACHARKDGTDCCNNTKHNKPPEQWLIAKFGEKQARKILKRIHAYFDSLTCQSGAETE